MEDERSLLFASYSLHSLSPPAAHPRPESKSRSGEHEDGGKGEKGKNKISGEGSACCLQISKYIPQHEERKRIRRRKKEIG